MTIASTPHGGLRAKPRHRLRVGWLYARALLHEFRWTLLALALAVVVGTVLHEITHLPELGGQRPSLGTSVYGAWMALLAQPLYQPPRPAYLLILYALYPLLGFILIGEGVVRLGLLMMSRRQGEKEWMQVVASTYRDHVILCGLGHLGFRVLEQLVAGGTPVLVLEKSKSNAFLAQAKAMNVPVLIRDMKEDQALLDAGVEHATSIIIASNDDISNLEVAVDSRRMNPKIRVVMRLFEQQLASKLAGALSIDVAFSSSALAAPVVAAMSGRTRVLSTVMIGGIAYVIAEIRVAPNSALASRKVGEIETGYAVRILALTVGDANAQSPPSASATVSAGDTLIIHTASTQLATVAAAGGAKP